VRDEFGDTVYTMVGPAEADIAKGMISHESPLGGALAGCTAGDTVSFETPAGVREVTVIEVA
jgi:transcription elongation factor GreA